MDHLKSTSYKVCHQSSASELEMAPDMTGVMIGGDEARNYSPDYAPYASLAEFNKDILLAEVGLLGDRVRISKGGLTASRTFPKSFRTPARGSRASAARTQSLRLPGSEVQWNSIGSFWFDIGGSDHFAPLLSFASQKVAVFGRGKR
jgi:hypothetical protein